MTLASEELDVLVVGAGISGISAAWHVHNRCPGKRYAVLEARENLGGTWDYFTYPGVRSDSDMYTLGFRFRPWSDSVTLAPGSAIKQYLHDTVRESGVDQHIRYQHRAVGASWSSETQRWTVRVAVGGQAEPVEITTKFLIYCCGYYRYDGGYTPDFQGAADFGGQIVHPQAWPEDLDWTGKRVVVIGSGATAITLVPELAKRAAHVVMLQRSPTYVMTLPGRDPLAGVTSKILPQRVAHTVTRWRAILQQLAFYNFSRAFPKAARAIIRAQAVLQLPKGYPVDVHFNPRYNPWDERVCVVPNGDLFRTIKTGKASVVTDQIDAFTPTGLRLRSGEELEADVVVTATGFNLSAINELPLSVDGTDVDVSERFAFKALMLSSVPNFVFTVGYTNASWTLKADLVSEYACRLINHLDANDYGSATPTLEHVPEQISELLGDFTPGYVQRAESGQPKQGPKAPWRLKMNYLLDLASIRLSKLDVPQLRFAARLPVGAPTPESVR